MIPGGKINNAYNSHLDPLYCKHTLSYAPLNVPDFKITAHKTSFPFLVHMWYGHLQGANVPPVWFIFMCNHARYKMYVVVAQSTNGGLLEVGCTEQAEDGGMHLNTPQREEV